MAAGSIVIDLLMKTGSFETDTKRAEARLKALEKQAVQMGKVLGGAFVAAGTAVGLLVKSSIDAADASIKLAQSVGTSVEAFTALSYAAELSGVSQDELGSSMAKLARTAADAASGVKSAAAGFDAIGVSVKNQDGTLKATDQLLGDIAEKFAGYADSAEKTAIAQELFGRSGAKLIPLLNGGRDGLEALKREAEALGIVIDTKTAKAAEEFNDTLTRIAKVADSVGLSLARETLPALQAIADAALEATKQGNIFRDTLDGIGQVGKAVFEALAVFAANVLFVFNGVGREIGAIAAQIAALARLDIQGFRAISDAVTEDARRARAELDKFEQRVLGLGGASIGSENDPRRGRGYTAPAGKQAPKLAGSGAAGGAGRAAKPDIPYAIRDPFEDVRQRFLQAEKDYEATDKILREIEDRARKAAEDAAASSAARLEGLLSNTSQARLQAVTEDIAFLNEQFAAGKIKDVEQWAEAVRGVTSRLPQDLEKANDIAQELGLTFSSAFEDAIVGGKGLRDVLKGIEQDILRIVTRQLITKPLAEAVTGLLGGGKGGGGLDFGKLIGSVGQFFGFGGAKAGGGDVLPGRAYMVGERGPEEFVPRTAGTIVPNQAGKGERQFMQTLNISVQGPVDHRTANQIAAEAGRAVRRAARVS